MADCILFKNSLIEFKQYFLDKIGQKKTTKIELVYILRDNFIARGAYDDHHRPTQLERRIAEPYVDPDHYRCLCTDWDWDYQMEEKWLLKKIRENIKID